MEPTRHSRGLKTLLLCSVAAITLSLQPSFAQDRAKEPSPDRPSAAPAQSPSDNQPAARQDRSEPKSTRPQAQGGAQERDRNAQTPAASESNRPQQSQSRDEQRGQQAQPRDSERTRQRDQAQDRDTTRPQQPNQAQDRDTTRTQQQQRDQARDSDQTRDRNNAQQQQNRTAPDTARTTDSNQQQAAQPTEQQRTRISTSIRQANVQPVRNVNFSVSVGTVVPTSVRFYPVTPAIVEVYPQYRGYNFILVEDEIVIVEPKTRRIVTVIDQRGSGRTASRSKLTLSEKQRAVIRRAATERRTTGTARTTTIERDITVGEALPETVEIESFPETVYTEVPEIRSYRYIVRDRDVYLVDPTERRVIEVIR